uniref:Ig-like domain-containing protein n=1 Tax=Oryzias latipes TaxID=8090 RepID=A0A3P9KFL7_ORYLA
MGAGNMSKHDELGSSKASIYDAEKGAIPCVHIWRVGVKSCWKLCPIKTTWAFLNTDLVQKEVKATVSQKTTLSCEVADTKTEVKWFKDGKQLTSSKTVHTESKGKLRQLVIDSVEKKDAGEYICDAGPEKMPFKIQVAGKSRE